MATSTVLAFSDEYERRSELELDSDMYGREFVDSLETPFAREDFNDLQEREPQWGIIAKIAEDGLKAGIKGAVKNTASNAISSNNNKHRRDLYDVLEEREPQWGFLAHLAEDGIKAGIKGAAKHTAKNALSGGNNGNNNKHRRDLDEVLEEREPQWGFLFKLAEMGIEKGVEAGVKKGAKSGAKSLAKHAANQGNNNNQNGNGRNRKHRRALEDDLFERDLDIEEFYGREYDLLDARAIFDDLD
jgi:hypothetical protein